MKTGVRFHIRDGGRGTRLAIGTGKVALPEAIAQEVSIAPAARKRRIFMEASVLNAAKRDRAGYLAT